MKIKLVDFNNYKEAIEIQNKIFPHEDGTLNILASLNRDLFMKETGLFYEDDNVKYYIALIDEEPIGITGIYRYQENEAWLAWFGILPKYQQNGYGKKLLEETIEIAKKQGYKTFRLYTDKVENANAIKLYEKLSFIGEKYTAEKLSYDCWIYSKSLYDNNIKLWNNKNLNLLYQSELDQIDKRKAKEILEIYDKLIDENQINN